MYSYLIINGKIWLQGKLIKECSSYEEALQVFDDPIKRDELENEAIKIFS